MKNQNKRPNAEQIESNPNAKSSAQNKSWKPNKKSRQQNRVRQQPSKDNSSQRVNFDNERVAKYLKDVSRDNDPRWYFNKSGLSDIATQINMFHPTGLAEAVPQNLDYGTNSQKYAVPGIFTIIWAPEITPRGRSAVLQALDSMYSYVVHKNSRNYNYDATDMGLLVLGTILTYSFIANAIRAYGVMTDWNGIDYYTPRALVEAMGFDYDNLSVSYHQMSYDINMLIAKLDQLWIPNTLPIAERWFWMNTNVYRDAMSAKAQYYMYVPATYYVYNPTAGEGYSTLDEKLWMSNGMPKNSWNTFTQAANSMIDALVNSQDRGMILADILNAYGANNIYKLNPISQDYKTTVAYEPEVLMQMENATIWGALPGTIVSTVDGALYSQGTTMQAQNLAKQTVGAPSRKVLNFHGKNLPTKEDIMVATRLSIIGVMLLGRSGTGDTALCTVCPLSCGTEVAVNAIIYKYQWNATNVPTLINSTFTTDYKAGWLLGSFSKTNVINSIFNWVAFDWAPTIEINVAPPVDVWNSTSIGDHVQYNHLMDILDYDQYVYLEEAQLNNLHNAAI